MAKRPVVRITTNFERNLEGIEHFLTGAEASRAFNGLLDELIETVIPNLEQFPEMGRPFLRHDVRSVEAANAVAALKQKLARLTPEADGVREYVFQDYLMLYAVIGKAIYLLAIRHHRQLSFDFEGHWRRG